MKNENREEVERSGVARLTNRTCMPRRAKITMKRKSKSNKDAIDCIEFNREATRFDSDFQYLKTNASFVGVNCFCGVYRAEASHLLGDFEYPEQPDAT